MYSNKAKSFAKFLAYAKRFKAADSNNFYKIATYKETGHFQAAFFAPAGLRHAQKTLYEFIGINGTHTSLRFQMTLLIAARINANNKTLLLL